MRPTVNACGNLTKDVSLEKTQKGTPVVRFTIACNAGKDDEPTFLWCVAYNKNAENIAKFFKKGSPIQILGDLRQYNDEKRQSHYVCDIRSFGFIGSARRDTTPPVDEKQDYQKDNAANDENQGDDIPF